MVAVHFTTIPCEPNRVIGTYRKPFFGEIHPCTNKIVYARFEALRPFRDQYREDAGDGAYGLSSLSDKTRTSNHLQMSL